MSANQIKLTNVRLSYPNLFMPTDYQGDGNFKYRAAFHIADANQIAAVKKTIQAVAAEKWKEKGKSVLAGIEGNTNKMCFIDGARKDVPGVWVLAASRKKEAGRPVVVDNNHTKANPQHLDEGSGRPYSGCYVNASVELWAYDNPKGKGISCTLIGVQFLKDGEPFSATPPASDDAFDDVSGDGADDLA